MDQKTIIINMLSKADSVPGQGVGSAFLEQVALVKQSDKFDIRINSRKKADIIHVHSLNPQYYLRMGKKTVNVAYCHLLPETLDGSLKLPPLIFKLFKRYVIRFYKKADWLVVVNPIFIEPLIAYGVKKERIVYIPNYVDQSMFHLRDDRQQLKKEYQSEKFTVLGVGQVQTRKGVSDFIETATRLPHINFIWAGGFSFKGITDGYRPLQKAMTEAPSNVKFIGIIPREKMNEIYNVADLMFLPSFNELFPMAILETIQLDLPFLLRDLDLYKPLFKSGYLSGRDVTEFARIIEKLATDQTYYQNSQQLSKNIRLFYNKDSVLKMWEDFYKSILNPKKE